MEHWALFNSVFNTSSIESLREEERLLASLIFENAREVVDSVSKSPPPPPDEDDDFTEKFELTRRNLLDIINAFNRAQNARNSFHEHFPNWAPSRKSNISTLRELADCINTDRFNCNVSKVTGSTVGILGGVALGASLVFPPAAIVLAIGGGIASFAGGATVFGTSVTEMTLLSKKMEAANVILEKDNKEFEFMAKWFKHTDELIALINQIIGFSVVQEISEGLKKFKGDVKKLASLKEGTMHSKLRELIILFVQKLAPDSFLSVYSPLALQIPVIVAFVFVMILFRKNNSLLFDCVVITHRTVFGLMKLLDLGSDLGMLICNAAMKTGVAATEVVTKATARMVTQGVLAGVGIALDVANLVITSFDIHSGSVSEKAVQLKDVADRLENELKVVEAVSRALSED